MVVVMLFLWLFNVGMLLFNVGVFSNCYSNFLLYWTILGSDDDKPRLAEFSP